VRNVLEVLEFPRIRALLGERAKTPLGRELALTLAPLPGERRINRTSFRGGLGYP